MKVTRISRAERKGPDRPARTPRAKTPTIRIRGNKTVADLLDDEPRNTTIRWADQYKQSPVPRDVSVQTRPVASSANRKSIGEVSPAVLAKHTEYTTAEMVDRVLGSPRRERKTDREDAYVATPMVDRDKQAEIRMDVLQVLATPGMIHVPFARALEDILSDIEIDIAGSRDQTAITSDTRDKLRLAGGKLNANEQQTRYALEQINLALSSSGATAIPGLLSGSYAVSSVPSSSDDAGRKRKAADEADMSAIWDAASSAVTAPAPLADEYRSVFQLSVAEDSDRVPFLYRWFNMQELFSAIQAVIGDVCIDYDPLMIASDTDQLRRMWVSAYEFHSLRVRRVSAPSIVANSVGISQFGYMFYNHDIDIPGELKTQIADRAGGANATDSFVVSVMGRCRRDPLRDAPELPPDGNGAIAIELRRVIQDATGLRVAVEHETDKDSGSKSQDDEYVRLLLAWRHLPLRLRSDLGTRLYAAIAAISQPWRLIWGALVSSVIGTGYQNRIATQCILSDLYSIRTRGTWDAMRLISRYTRVDQRVVDAMYDYVDTVVRDKSELVDKKLSDTSGLILRARSSGGDGTPTDATARWQNPIRGDRPLSALGARLVAIGFFDDTCSDEFRRKVCFAMDICVSYSRRSDYGGGAAAAQRPFVSFDVIHVLARFSLFVKYTGVASTADDNYLLAYITSGEFDDELADVARIYPGPTIDSAASVGAHALSDADDHGHGGHAGAPPATTLTATTDSLVNGGYAPFVEALDYKHDAPFTAAKHGVSALGDSDDSETETDTGAAPVATPAAAPVVTPAAAPVATPAAAPVATPAAAPVATSIAIALAAPVNIALAAPVSIPVLQTPLAIGEQDVSLEATPVVSPGPVPAPVPVPAPAPAPAPAPVTVRAGAPALTHGAPTPVAHNWTAVGHGVLEALFENSSSAIQRREIVTGIIQRTVEVTELIRRILLVTHKDDVYTSVLNPFRDALGKASDAVRSTFSSLSDATMLAKDASIFHQAVLVLASGLMFLKFIAVSGAQRYDASRRVFAAQANAKIVQMGYSLVENGDDVHKLVVWLLRCLQAQEYKQRCDAVVSLLVFEPSITEPNQPVSSTPAPTPAPAPDPALAPVSASVVIPVTLTATATAAVSDASKHPHPSTSVAKSAGLVQSTSAPKVSDVPQWTPSAHSTIESLFENSESVAVRSVIVKHILGQIDVALNRIQSVLNKTQPDETHRVLLYPFYLELDEAKRPISAEYWSATNTALLDRNTRIFHRAVLELAACLMFTALVSSRGTPRNAMSRRVFATSANAKIAESGYKANKLDWDATQLVDWLRDSMRATDYKSRCTVMANLLVYMYSLQIQNHLHALAPVDTAGITPVPVPVAVIALKADPVAVAAKTQGPSDSKSAVVPMWHLKTHDAVTSFMEASDTSNDQRQQMFRQLRVLLDDWGTSMNMALSLSKIDDASKAKFQAYSSSFAANGARIGETKLPPDTTPREEYTVTYLRLVSMILCGEVFVKLLLRVFSKQSEPREPASLRVYIAEVNKRMDTFGIKTVAGQDAGLQRILDWMDTTPQSDTRVYRNAIAQLRDLIVYMHRLGKHKSASGAGAGVGAGAGAGADPSASVSVSVGVGVGIGVGPVPVADAGTSGASADVGGSDPKLSNINPETNIATMGQYLQFDRDFRAKADANTDDWYRNTAVVLLMRVEPVVDDIKQALSLSDVPANIKALYRDMVQRIKDTIAVLRMSDVSTRPYAFKQHFVVNGLAIHVLIVRQLSIDDRKGALLVNSMDTQVNKARAALTWLHSHQAHNQYIKGDVPTGRDSVEFTLSFLSDKLEAFRHSQIGVAEFNAAVHVATSMTQAMQTVYT